MNLGVEQRYVGKGRSSDMWSCAAVGYVYREGSDGCCGKARQIDMCQKRRRDIWQGV